ncbi:MAG: CHAT domain-containing protein, partial [Acidobacteria bacterium]
LALTAEADPLLNRLLTLPALARLANVRVARLSPPAADALHQQLRGRHALLHVRLPLLAGGRTVVVGLPGGTAAALDEEIGRATQVDLVTLDPAGGFVEAPASRVRGAERLVERGARAALVPLEPLPEDWAPEFWERFYTELGRGRRKTEALRRALAGRRPAVHFVLLGHADTRVVPPLRVLWPVWAALGAVLVVLSVVLLRVLRRPQDPFDIEPPEEPEEQAEGA